MKSKTVTRFITLAVIVGIGYIAYNIWVVKTGVPDLGDNAAAYYMKIVESYDMDNKPPDLSAWAKEHEKYLLKGSKCTKSSFHPEYYPEPTDFSALLPYLNALRNYSKAILEYADQLIEKGKADHAVQLVQAVGIMGDQIKDEGELTITFLVGTAIRSLESKYLVKYFDSIGDKENKLKYQKIIDQQKKEQEELKKYSNLSGTADINTVARLLRSEAKPYLKELLMTGITDRAMRGQLQKNHVLKLLHERIQHDKSSQVRNMAQACIKAVKTGTM